MQVSPEMDPSASDQQPPEPWGWTRRQRIALGTLLAILLTLLAINFYRRPAHLNPPAHLIENPPVALPQKMNPNTATAAELARIPYLGETLAARIIDYREAQKTTSPEGLVFRTLDDLDRINGIGPSLLQQMEPYLEFPVAPPLTP